MTFRTLLAPLSGTHDDVGVLAWAVALADRFDARLDALFVRRSAGSAPDFLGDAFSTYGVEDLLNQLAAAAETARDQAQDAFAAATAKLAEKRVGDFRDRVGHPRDVIGRECRLADLVVVAAPGAGPREPRWDAFESAVLGGVRPVLSVPDSVSADAVGLENVLVAWDGGVEAARAVNASLPFLTRAKNITVLRVGENSEDLEPVADLARYLDAHGVEANGRTAKASSGSAAQAILDQAAETGADLLVMGAFGHSLWPAPFRGGITARIAKQAAVPLLLTH